MATEGGLLSASCTFVLKCPYYTHSCLSLFKPYEPSWHNRLISEDIESQIYAWEDNQRIFEFMLQWLEFRQIEHLTYHRLQTILTYATRDRNRKLRETFAGLLQPEHTRQLDRLLGKQGIEGKEKYLLSTLHRLNPSDAPKQTRANIDKLQVIQSIFDTVKPLLNQMDLPPNAIRYWGGFCHRLASIQY